MTTSNGFLDITSIHLPQSCAYEALAWLYKVGRRNVEGVALWAGVREGNVFF